MLHEALALLLILVPTSSAPPAGAPKAVVSIPGHQFGRVIRGTVVEHEFVLKNEGTAPLRILSARMSAPLLPSRMPAQVAPGSEALVRFKLDTASLEGPFDGLILLSLNDADMAEAALTFEGEVVPSVEVSPMPAFFVAAQRGEPKQASLEILNHEPEVLRIERVEHAVDRFTTKLETLEEGQRYRLSLTLNPDAPGGKWTDIISITTSSATRPVLRIPANTYLREKVYTFPEAVDLGALRLADIQADPDLLRRAAQPLMVYQSGGSDFRASARTDLPALEVTAERGPAGDRYQITIKLVRERIAAGPIKATITIETNDPQFPSIIVPVWGLILAN